MPNEDDKTINNLWLQRAAIVIGILSALSGAALAVDSRYANANEVKTKFIEVETKQVAAIKKLESRFNRNASDRLKNEIFKLEFKKNDTTLTALDAALLERYKRSLEKIEAEEAKD